MQAKKEIKKQKHKDREEEGKNIKHYSFFVHFIFLCFLPPSRHSTLLSFLSSFSSTLFFSAFSPRPRILSSLLQRIREAQYSFYSIRREYSSLSLIIPTLSALAIRDLVLSVFSYTFLSFLFFKFCISIVLLFFRVFFFFVFDICY